MAVIKTGRRRTQAPSTLASARARPSRVSRFKCETSTMPFWRAMPKSAMNPTEAGTDRFWSVSHRATAPPTSARGMFKTIRRELRMAPKLRYRSRKTAAKVAGTTRARRRLASCWSSNWPPQVTRYPVGSSTASARAAWASATKEPMSRPRTLHCTVVKRWFPSRVICRGTTISSMAARSRSGTRAPPGAATRTSPMASGVSRASAA